MYPTEKEIVTGPGPPIEQELIILKKWKTKHFKGWSKIPEKEKEKKIISLLKEINEEKKGKKVKIKFNKKITNCYIEHTRTINLNKISIISGLHELAHHLFGESELTACRYSVWLFKETFPITFTKMIFKGHLLVKKVEN